MPEPMDSFDLPAHYASQQCEERDAATYCVSPMYSSWVDHWEETVDGVGDLVPTEIDRVAASLEDGGQALDRAIDTYPITFQAVDLPHHSATQVFVADARPARDLLELPTSQVNDTLASRWDEVVHPSTTSAQLADWFHLPAPSRPDVDLEMEPCR